MLRLARFLRDYKKQVILGPIFKLIEAVFELIVPLVMADIIDKGVGAGDRGYVLKMGGVLVILGVVGLCSALTCQYFASVASQGTGTALRNALYEHISSFSHAQLDRFGTPTLITRMTGDINQLQLAVAMLIRLVIRAPFLAVGAVIMAMTIDLRLSLIFLAVTPLIVLVLYIIMNRSIPFYRLIQQKLDRITRITRENLSGARVIRAFSKQKSERKRFEDACSDSAETAVRVGRLSALLNPLTTIIMNAGIIAIIYFGGYRVNSGNLTQGELVALINYMNQVLLALIVTANIVVIFTKASASASRVNELFDASPSVAEREDAFEDFGDGASSAEYSVEFDDVTFAYSEKSEPVLKNVSLGFKRGSTVGIIGGTGAGKSTLAALIMRFYDVVGGSVKVLGRDVRDMKQTSLRKAIGYVPQKAELLSGTIAENLRLGNENADEDKLWRAVGIAQASDFVSKLKDGLDSRVEQGGRNFSGGQRQRLTIARALAMEPEILILDDSVSALDAATDLRLRRAVAESFPDATIILISQRVGSIKHADQIIVMDDGEIAGSGTHESLYESCQVYRDICDSQLEGGVGNE